MACHGTIKRQGTAIADDSAVRQGTLIRHYQRSPSNRRIAGVGVRARKGQRSATL